MKKLMGVIMLIMITLCFVSCKTENKSADTIQNQQTAAALNQAQKEIGMPNIVNFQQRKLLKQIYELCDKENLICYMYTISELSGKFIFQGKCIGYGIPFSAQFTNPEKIVEGDKYFGYDLNGYLNYLRILPQADPNGLFMPTSSSATWIMMIDPKGIPRVVYIEPTITVSPFLLPYAIYPDEFNKGIPKIYPGVEIK